MKGSDRCKYCGCWEPDGTQLCEQCWKESKHLEMAKKKLDWSRVKVLSDNAIEVDSKGLTSDELTSLVIAAEGRYNKNK